MASRNSNQEKAMTIIYAALTYQSMQENYDLIELINDLVGEDYQSTDFYLKEVVVKSLAHQDEIIPIIEESLHNWKFSRLNRISQAILLLSYAHFYYVKGVQKAVVIDVAVNLAKKFIPSDDYKYINAVLDHILNE